MELPFHLCTLAGVRGGVDVAVEGPVTIGAVLDAVEATCPMLRGTIRDHGTLKRRPFLRFFAGGKDLSHEPTGSALPESVASGREPFLIVGAIAGG